MLIALLVILCIIFSIALYLLLAPVVLEINSAKGLYRLRLHKLAWARLYFLDYEPWLELKVAWWYKQFNLLQMPKTNKQVKSITKPKKKKNKKAAKFKWATAKRVLKSFKVENFCWHLDTGDYVLNAQLYPLFWWYKFKSGHSTEINFIADNYLALTIKNNGWRLLKAIIINK